MTEPFERIDYSGLPEDLQPTAKAIQHDWLDFHRRWPSLTYYGNLPAKYSENATSWVEWMHWMEGWVAQINANLDNLNQDFNDFILDYNKTIANILQRLLSLEALVNGTTIDDLKKQISDLKNDLNIIDNPLTRLNHQEIIGAVDAKGLDGKSFIQGIQIVPERNELFVIRKDADLSEVIISRYNFTNFVEKDSITVSTNSKMGYTEGLVYYLTANNQIKFLIRSSYDHIAFWVNYDTNFKEPDFVLPGAAKLTSDISKKYVLSNFGSAPDLQGIYLYDFETVKQSKPVLIKQIRLNTLLMYDEKVQGISFVDNKIVLSHGKKQPKTTVLTLDGTIIDHISFDKFSVRDMVNTTYPSINTNYPDIRYEAEGSTSIIENGKEYAIITHVFYQTGKAFITKIGVRHGSIITPGTTLEKLRVPNWLPIPDLGENVKPYSIYPSEQPMFSIDSDGFVTLRGLLTYPKRTTSSEVLNLILFTLPYPYITFTNQIFNGVAGGTASSTNRFKIGRDKNTSLTTITLLMTNDISDKPYVVLDGIRFHTETRYESAELAGEI